MEPQATENIQVQPSPTSVRLDMVMDQSQKKWLLLQFFTVHGTQVYFLEPEFAEKFGELLKGAGQQAKSSLILPQSGGFQMPNGHKGQG